MQLYPRNNECQLDKDLFENPTPEYRGVPFWCWNTKLQEEELLRQIDVLKQMGMGGFDIHSRTGLDIPYLGNEFFELIKASNKKAKELGMLTWLYDEDRWPSGYGGGLVTKEKKYRSRYLVFTKKKKEEMNVPKMEVDAKLSAHANGNGTLIGIYQVKLEKGFLTEYQKVEEENELTDQFKIWYAYLEVAEDTAWFNNQAYVNTLDEEAIKRFIEVTHEKYYQEIGEEFGKSIPAIFTDEPQFNPKKMLSFAEADEEIIIPYTDDFEHTFQEKYQVSFLNHLPEVFWELPNDERSQIRYFYHDHISERFSAAFADTVGKWCKEHNIMLTGHLMMEPTLLSQSTALGEAMRPYRSFDLPGIDMLCDRREFTTAKQAQSVAHQYGRPGVLSEIYGVTNWDFDFRHHKLQGDWQAALGITTRVHHLALVSIAGEAKRDYPASINYQSPWAKEYAYIENHFARVNTAMTRGKAGVDVAVIHPVESYWVHFGPNDQTGEIRKELDAKFQNITEWLLLGLIDFDFISESLLPLQNSAQIQQPLLQVGEMQYKAVIVPSCETIRSTTLKRLQAFSINGGRVIFAGNVPDYVDGKKSNEAKEFAKICIQVPFSKRAILKELEEVRMLDIRVQSLQCENTVFHERSVFSSPGERTNNLLYQCRHDQNEDWVFICNAYNTDNQDVPLIQDVKICFHGIYQVEEYNTLTGTSALCECSYEEEKTIVKRTIHYHDSFLFSLKPITNAIMKKTEQKKRATIIKYMEFDQVKVTLSEPNVLVLDLAEYAFDDGAWRNREEVLRIDNEYRNVLGYPLRRAALAQPWTLTKLKDDQHVLSLRYFIQSKIDIDFCELAFENAKYAKVYIDTQKLEHKITGWYVDKAIKKVSLGGIKKGIHELVIKIPFSPKTNIESAFLLGDFGVEVQGEKAVIIEPVRCLAFGDWTKQGLPFYGGNVTYHMNLSTQKGTLKLKATHYRNSLLKVSLNKQKEEYIVLSPYEAILGQVEEGEQRIELIAFGNRINTFGTLHNCDPGTKWFGPDAWRSEADRWSYEYQIKPTGVLISPIIEVEEESK